MSHLDEGLLTSLLDGELSPEARREAETHLAGCAECRGLYDEIRSFSTEADALVTAIELPRPPSVRPVPTSSPTGSGPARRPLPWRTMAWAATLTVAVGLGYFARGLDRPAASKELPGDVGFNVIPEADAAQAPAAGGPATAVVPAPAPDTAPQSLSARRRDPGPLTQPQAAEGGGQDERELAVAGARQEVAAVPAPASPPSSAPAEPLAPAVLGATASLDRSVRDQPSTAAKAINRLNDNALREVAMEDAVRILGGTIRLLDGLKPERVLAGAGTLVSGAEPGSQVVRVVYEDPPGRELWLDQQRVASEERSASGYAARALLPGDTVLTASAQGMQSVRWVDQRGFRLALTGFLSTDSLRQLMARVQ